VSLVERHLVESRERAQALILAGKVSVDGQRAEKPGLMVAAEAKLDVQQPLRYVSRGGVKLEAALEHFCIDVRNCVCFDIGTSTGGFTDCLLQHGAARVHAVDTGAGQIAWKLRTDARVVLHENVNARYLTLADIGEEADFIACDVSFISVTLLLPAVTALLKDTGQMVILVKPQFEAGREQIGKGGIVRDAPAQTAACDKVKAAVEAHGFETQVIDSPILGAEGNREMLLHARRKYSHKETPPTDTR
jgi:23S rRNA (cytidine1920-2'-O)/16S rRNA (cytidine1409-2'-O)-methyltransferase